MADKNLVMIFLNEEGAKASFTLPAVRDEFTYAEVASALDVVTSKNIFYSSGGNLAVKHAAQVTERSVTEPDVK